MGLKRGDKIGLLTSGGDSPGMNAAIRAAALRAHHGFGWKTIGLRYGTLGLLKRPVDALAIDPTRLEGALARQGGTFLGSTNHGNPFAFPMPDGSVTPGGTNGTRWPTAKSGAPQTIVSCRPPRSTVASRSLSAFGCMT